MLRRSWLGVLATASLLTLLSTLALLSVPATTRGAEPPPPLPPHVAGEVIVKFRADLPLQDQDEIRSDLGFVEIQRLDSIRAELTVLRDMTVAEALSRYANDPRVEYIEPNYILSAQVLPNDDGFPLQWGMHNIGQTGGDPGADIMADEAWDVFTGAGDVVVAVIDSGIDYNHPDLADNIYVNIAEVPDNGVDEDNNGFVDDVRGWNFIFFNNDASDDNGHGTHVAGTVGAVGNNSIGVAGASWNVKLMPLKFLNSSGLGSTAAAISCIQYATLMGADIINASWGGGVPSEALNDAVAASAAADIVFVAAAGNANPGINTDLQPFLPAGLDHPNIIAVGASDDRDRLWNESNFGANSVDLAAPGVNIYSTLPGGGYAFLSGTSMAAPHVSGTMALVRGRFPTLSAVEAKALLLDRSNRIDALVGLIGGGRRLNAFLPIASDDDTPPARITTLAAGNSESNRIDLTWIATGDDADQGTATRYQVRYSTQNIDADNFDDAFAVNDVPDPLPAGSEELLQVRGLQFSTTYYFAIRALDEFGNASPISNIAIGTTAGPPSVIAEPGSFSADLFTGQTATRTLTLDNTGLGEYAFSIEIARPATSGGAQAPFSLPIWNPSSELPPMNPSAQSYDPGEPQPWDGPSFSPPTESTGDIQGSGAADGLRILFLRSGADVTQIMGQLAVLDDVAFVDELDIRLAAPSLEDLAGFDAVIFVANNPVTDQVTTGNVLADYADSGGGVVMTLASLIAGWEVRGRFLEEAYFPIELGSGPIGESSLGPFDSTHPIMQGVTEAAGGLLGDLTLAPGAQLVAEWENGEPFVTTKRGSVVAINVYVAGNGFWSGDVPLILRNAVFWASNTIDWLATDPRSGTVPAGSSREVEVIFDAGGLGTGNYQAEIVLTGNDPDDPIIRLPASLTVTGAADLSVLPVTTDFGSLFVGESAMRNLLIRNFGTETAIVSSIFSDHPDFSAGAGSLELAAGGSVLLPVTFTPTTEGAGSASLTFFSNDPDQPEVSVALLGVGQIPPQIALDPGSFSVNLFTGQTATDTLTVSNQGGSQLDVQLAVQIATQLEAISIPNDTLPVAPAGLAGPPGEAVDLSFRASAQAFDEPFVFGDDFEDGLFDGWNEEQNLNIKEVSEGGANGTNFSYHQINFSQGHFNGIARSFGEQRPSYASFYVRSSSTTTNDGYFVVRAINGLEAIFFFARDSGVFYCNQDVGGNSSVAYTADTWYFIEFRDIDFDGRHFDYYVNGSLIQEDIPLRDTGNDDAFWEVDLYNFDDDSEAWWDEIYIADEPPVLPVEVGLPTLSLAPGTSVDVPVAFNATGLPGGQLLANIAVTSNDPDNPQLLVPATLNVSPAADIDVSDLVLNWGPVFVGQSAQRTLDVANIGFEPLTVSLISTDDPAFTSDLTSLLLEPGETRELILTFTPPVAGARTALLSITSNDLDEGSLTVTLTAEGLIPPAIDASPTSFQQELFTGELQSQTMTLSNGGGSDLVFEILIDTADTSAPAASLDTGPGPHVEVTFLGATAPAVGVPFEFEDGFEDGDFDGWTDAGGSALKEITADTAANGTVYSYHEDNAAGGHFTGIYHVLPNTRPVYASFFVRPGSETTPDAYFALRDANGVEGIFFFAGPDGNFGINSNVGGNQSVAYTAYTWYFIEFKQIDWLTKTFDYYVNGVLIQEQIPFRNPTLIGGFSRLDLYSFQPGAEAWWDEIRVSTVEPPTPVSASPIVGVVPAGESIDVLVNFNAKNLAGGVYRSEILIGSNDPVRPLITATASLSVIEAPDIELTEESLEFDPLFIGVSTTKTFSVFNDGVAPLTLAGLSVDDPDFTVDTAGFTLAPGGFREIEVRFAPSRAGVIAATLTLASDDPDEPMVFLALSGEGRVPPDAGITPTSLQADLFTGQMLMMPLTLSNTGAGDLNWRILFADDEQPDWLTIEPDSGSLAGSESMTLEAGFDAEALAGGDYLAEILIVSNDPDQPELPVPVLLRVTSAADISLSEPQIDFGDVFVDTPKARQLTISNDGVLDLVVSQITVDAPNFVVGTTSVSVPPDGSANIDVTFTAPALGTFTGTLTLISNDPVEGVLGVPMIAEGSVPPAATVTPTSVSADLLVGEVATRTLTLGNTGGSDLTFEVFVEERFELDLPAALAPVGTADEAVEGQPWVEVARELSAAETAGPPSPIVNGGLQAQAGPQFLADDFEDGNFQGWKIGSGEGVRLVTSETAANDTMYSYRETLSSVGHLDGIYQDFGPAQPGYVGFWVRSGDDAAEDGYFVIRDSEGREVIWFFARSNGRFYINADSGGHQSFDYEEDRWYHIEFKNISFQTQRFDYYVDGRRIKFGIRFRNFGNIFEMSRVDLYNFTQGSEAWWDEIVIAAERPFLAISASPAAGTVTANGQTDLQVRFDAREVFGGLHLGNVVIRTNDPAAPEIIVPADLGVTGIPEIGSNKSLLDFDTVRVGIPASMPVTITNFGTDLLVVDSVQVSQAEFTFNQSAFELGPLESTAVTVTLTADSPGPKNATLLLTSNDEDEPEYRVELTGNALIAADLVVEPVSLQEDLVSGQMSTRTLALSNSGGELLDYTVTLDDLSAAGIPTDVTIFRDDMEGDTSGWTPVSYSTEGLWHLTEFDANTPTHSWWCSQPDAGHYATPFAISNAVISPPLDLRGLRPPISLSFYENYETEPGWDKCMVDVSIDGGTTWIPLRGDYGNAPSGSTQGWVLENLSLTPFAENIVQVRFYFETLDATNNAFPGWRFDDVRVHYSGPPWLNVTPREGSIAPFNSDELLVTFDALEPRPSGEYQGSIEIASNDPDVPVFQLPVTMNVAEAARIALPGERIAMNSSFDLGDGAVTRHSFGMAFPPVGDGLVQLQAHGDFDAPNKKATLIAEAFVLGSAGSTGTECAVATQSFTLSTAQMRALAADGVIDMAVRNSPEVGTCDVNSHTLELIYTAGREVLDLGTVDAGDSTTTTLEIGNDGSGVLRLHAIESDSADVTVNPAALDIPPMSRAEVEVTFAPVAAGVLAGRLSLTSNDPVRGTVTLGIVGEARLQPAIATIAPDALVAALPPQSDRTRTKTVRLSNTGQADLHWNATMFELGNVEPAAGTIASRAAIDIAVTFAAAGLEEGDYQSTLTIDSNSQGGPIDLPLTLHVRETELQHVAVDFSPRFTDRTDTVEFSLELDPGYDPHNIMVSSMTLNDCMAAEAFPVSYSDTDLDGILELIVQFEEETLNECLPRNPPDGIHVVTVAGEIEDEAWFTGTAYLRGIVQIAE